MRKNLFGEMFIELRIGAKYTLRSFCREVEFDAGNWSRIESGLAMPPTDPKFFKKVAKLFKLDEQKMKKLISLAKAVRIIPKELRETQLMEHMPTMLRKIDGQQLNEDEIESLIKWIKDTVLEENKKS